MSTVAPPWSYTLHLSRDPRSPGIARSTLRSVLAAYKLGGLAPTAELLASELLTNAHLHTGGPYALHISPTASGQLRLGVWDKDPTVPSGLGAGFAHGVMPDEGSEGGRGLALVRAYADAWGASPLGDTEGPSGGKVLWAECGWRGPS
ncbi:ATP-binding protein [Streptomyces lusitanus]|uniref:ATP-binding protein n=1 Tax=Streptomyces lusitanus TaxID=68232 RepID=A0ABU3JTK3_9ACTN|nr:ATP-binding protein [Streptomyces lusitanus]